MMGEGEKKRPMAGGGGDLCVVEIILMGIEWHHLHHKVFHGG